MITLSGPFTDVLNCRTLAEIQRKVDKQGKRNVVVRLVHAKDDKDKIAAWKQDLVRVLNIFTVRVIMDYNGMDSDYRTRGVRVRDRDFGLSGQIWKVFSDSNQPQSRVLKEYDGRYSSLPSLFSFPLCSQATKIPKRCPFCSPYRPSVSRVSLPLGSFHFFFEDDNDSQKDLERRGGTVPIDKNAGIPSFSLDRRRPRLRLQFCRYHRHQSRYQSRLPFQITSHQSSFPFQFTFQIRFI